MSGPPPVGVFIATSTPPERIAAMAAEVEQLGLSELWVAEDYFLQGGFAAAAIALSSTERLRVGLGIVASVARHPAVTAMEIATLSRAYPGRFIPGIGHGVPAWTDQMGLTPASPLTALRECVTGVRELLEGKTLDQEGKQFTFGDITLTHVPDEVPPLLTGVLGPKSLRLSGRVADGTVMSVLASTTYLERALEDINAGMAESGRTEHLVPTFALTSVSNDGAKARAAVRPALAGYLQAVGAHNPLSGALGYNAHLAELLESNSPLADVMPEEWVDTMTVAGDPEEVTGRIRALLAAGATSVVLSPVDPTSALQELRLVAESVLPALS